MNRQSSMSVREAAQRLGVTLDYLQRLLWANRLPGAQKERGRWAIPSAAVKEYVERRKARQAGVSPQKLTLSIFAGGKSTNR